MRWSRALVFGVVLACLPASAQAAREHSTTDRLKDRRAVAAGARAYSDRLPGRPLLRQRLAHHRRDGRDLVAAAEARRRHLVRDRRRVGQARHALHERPRPRPLRVPADRRAARSRRTDFVPDNRRAALYGLMLRQPGADGQDRDGQGRRPLRADGRLPVDRQRGHPTAADNLIDIPAYQDGRLVFTDKGTLPGARRTTTPRSSAPPARPRPARPAPASAVRSPAPRAAPATRSRPSACDDGPHGKGVGGQLRYRVTIGARGVETVWIAVAGSNRGLDDARKELDMALQDPDAQLRPSSRRATSSPPARVVDLPGDRRLQEAVDWGKQNLADLTQTATDLQVRFVDQGKAYPRAGRDDRARDVLRRRLPGLPVAVRHRRRVHGLPRASRSASSRPPRRTCARSAPSRTCSTTAAARSRTRSSPTARSTSAPNKDPGNTDESVKFPSAVALVWRWTGDNAFRDNMYDFSKRAMRYVTDELDADNDGWPEGLGNVERDGHGRGEARQRRLLRPRPLRPRRHGALQARPHDRALGDRHRRPRPPPLRLAPGGTARPSTPTRCAPARASSSGTGSASRRWRRS